MGKLSAEVAQQRPLWEHAKQMEEVHHAEIAEVDKKQFREVVAVRCLRSTPPRIRSHGFEAFLWGEFRLWHSKGTVSSFNCRLAGLAIFSQEGRFEMSRARQIFRHITRPWLFPVCWCKHGVSSRNN